MPFSNSGNLVPIILNICTHLLNAIIRGNSSSTGNAYQRKPLITIVQYLFIVLFVYWQNVKYVQKLFGLVSLSQYTYLFNVSKVHLFVFDFHFVFFHLILVDFNLLFEYVKHEHGSKNCKTIPKMLLCDPFTHSYPPSVDNYADLSFLCFFL